MGATLRALLVHGDRADEPRITQELAQEFADPKIVSVADMPSLIRAFESGEFDVVIIGSHSDWAESLATLHTVRARYPYCPVILLTNPDDEEKAAKMLKAGVDDDVVASNAYLARLCAAVRTAIGKRQDHRLSEEAYTPYHRLFEEMPLGFYLSGPDGRIFSVNPALARMLGYPNRESLLATHVADLYSSPADHQRWQMILEREGAVRNFQAQLRCYDGTMIWAQMSAHTTHAADGQSLSCQGIVQDITEQKWAEDALRQSQQQHEALIHSIEGIVWEADAQTFQFSFVSQQAERLLGYPVERWIQEPTFWQDHVHPEDQGWALDFCFRATTEKRDHEFEYRIIAADGRIVWLRDIVRVIVENDRPVKLRGVMVDMTEQKRAETQIKASLREKEVLLQEVHHRVKNNLQIISSLLNLQSRYTEDERTLELFKESRNRIKSMALIHEKLYRSQYLAKIDLADYIRSLITHLIRSYNVDPQTITLNLRIDDSSLDVDAAVPCGLIVNELVSNALKYAFPAGRSGAIDVELSREEGTRIKLVIRDNGIGLPTDVDLQTTSSLGLKLVTALVSQLDGTLSVHTKKGTEFRILFSIPSSKKEDSSWRKREFS